MSLVHKRSAGLSARPTSGCAEIRRIVKGCPSPGTPLATALRPSAATSLFAAPRLVYDCPRAHDPRGIIDMAVLAKHPEGTRSIVLSPHLVGRSRLADLRMTEPTVSGEYAVLRWVGREWELHDLGSR